MLSFWLSNNWFLLALTILFGSIFILLIKASIANDKKEGWKRPIDEATVSIGIALSGIFTIVPLVIMMYDLHQTSESYGKTYTMVVDIHYSPNKVVRKTLVSENESFRIEYYNSYARISGADGTYLVVNAPIEIVSNTYKQNGK